MVNMHDCVVNPCDDLLPDGTFWPGSRPRARRGITVRFETTLEALRAVSITFARRARGRGDDVDLKRSAVGFVPY